ncbi:MAG: hypothetical protein NUV56_02760, partial [Candidatus Uhrbacteria bacterium]|nr:hypothetical protein [Candidatus Uhrbacteria bacterium]
MTTAPRQPEPIGLERLQEELAHHVEDAAHAAMLDGVKPDTAMAQAEAQLGDRKAIAIEAERVAIWHTIRHLKLEFVFAILLGLI